MRLRTVPLALLALAACHRGPDEAPRAALKVEAVGELTGEPALDGPDAIVTRSSQSTLVALNPSGEVVPGLATSWRVSDDGLSIIFRLREAKWPDGRIVTAGDIVAVYRRVLAPGSRHPLVPLLLGIVGAPDVIEGRKPVRALGVNDPLPNIVEIRLTGPHPELLQLLASPSMAIVRRGDPPPTSGAFAVDPRGEQAVKLIRNPTYYDAGSVPLGSIRFKAIDDVRSGIADFRAGKTDILFGDGLAGASQAADIKASFKVDPVWSTYAYRINRTRGPLADVRVRRAMAMVIDRDALGASLPQALRAVPLTGVVPSALPSDNDPARPDWSDWEVDARLAEATRLLGEAGYGPQKPLSVEVLVPHGDEHRAILAAISDAWSKIGIQTVVIEKDQDDIDEALAKRRYQLALEERAAPADSVSFFLTPFRCQADPACNRAAEAKMSAARVTPDQVQRSQTIRQAEQLIVDDAPQISLLSMGRWALVAPRVSGWSPNPLGHSLSRLDVLPPT